MRPLTEDETKVLFEKVSKYTPEALSSVLFREEVLKRAENVGRDSLVTVGVCFGKFTKTTKFKLHVTCLDYLAQYAKFKIWIKPTAEMSYLYGNHILKAHVAKMTEDVPEHQGGFAVTAKSAAMCVKLDPTAIVGFHQTDIGEYLRDEDSLI
ncbi:60S ribosome subunit biogenesis protein NIP7 [Paramicrosporidium saccamoebae]|uniref:60S ribosome subunit biogenesis protein NIP7 n=1 Tax=Paramicrosporidium saccamoebae TaxID=1246581 RepID=A0A2H9TJA3_9FUNG|nr:60S ribosome subunit biogenesis protein NIP7 [Paramicrosporidium saccamoebae]